MEKFLQNHKLTIEEQNTNECYLIEVYDKCEDIVEFFHAHCWIDVLRVQKYYLSDRAQFWWTVRVTRV